MVNCRRQYETQQFQDNSVLYKFNEYFDLLQFKVLKLSNA